MRFVFISTMAGSPWGGSEELWSQAALRLHEEGHEVSAWVIWWPRLPSGINNLTKRGIDVVALPPPPMNLPARIGRKLKKRISNTRPEVAWLRKKQPALVIVSQGSNRDGLEWMRLCCEGGWPYAAIVQCNSEVWWPTDKAADGLAAAYRSAKNVFCVSLHNLQLLECQLGESLPNASVVWNPFNVSADQPPAWPKEDGMWKIACVARLEPAAKGQDLLLQVLAQPKWRNRSVEVNFYGIGPCEDNLRRLIERFDLKNVHLRGHISDIKSIWKYNHLLVLPSRYEGLPLALVEAMYCGRPALVTDVGGNAEMCVDGETGFVAAAPSVRLLEETMERAWSRHDDWQEMGMSGRANVERLVPKDPVGDFYRQLLKSAEKQKV